MLVTLRPVKGFKVSGFISGWVNLFKILVLYFAHFKMFDPLMFCFYTFSSDLWITAVWCAVMSTSHCHVRKRSWTVTRLLWEARASVCLFVWKPVTEVLLPRFEVKSCCHGTWIHFWRPRFFHVWRLTTHGSLDLVIFENLEAYPWQPR